jgi:transposase
MTLVGPLPQNPSWQKKAEGAYAIDQFAIDWDRQVVQCPQGHASRSWHEYVNAAGHPYLIVRFRKADCSACEVRSLCTRARAQQQPRCLYLHPKSHQEAVPAAQERLGSEAGTQLYQQRAGVEGTLSQGVRAFGLRQARYRGLAKTHLQQVATAAAMNLERIVAWWTGVPRATTRTSRFAALAA